MSNSYTYLWEFHVRAELTEEFEHHYGPNGSWALLFRQSPGYIETLLLKDRMTPGRYVTMDRWQSEAAHHTFRSIFAKQYSQLDNLCERLTISESSLGEFCEFVP